MKTNREESIRIVSLAPSATSILCAIGANGALVGVTKWCADVAPVNNLPKLGDCWHMESMDEIVRLKPTLVIGSVPYKQETVAKLLEKPFAFLAMNPRTLANINADIRLLGGITQKAAAAEGLVKKMRSALLKIARQNRRVHVISDELLNTPGPPLIEGASALHKLLYPENRMRERL